MDSSEELCLRWNDFQENISTMFQTIRGDNAFADVTLASDDGQQFEVHRVVLAASSSFFQNLLKASKHTHPLIYMRGMSSEDLSAVIDFIYYGVVKINHEKIDTFLSIAEELRIYGVPMNEDGNQYQLNSPVISKAMNINPPVLKGLGGEKQSYSFDDLNADLGIQQKSSQRVG
jgi:hypothetical protein